MNMKKYSFVHLSEANHSNPFPLSQQQVEHHFSCLSGDIARHLDASKVASQVEIVTQHGLQSAKVTLTSADDGIDLDVAMEKCICTINLAQGLCFVISEADKNDHT